MKEFITALIIIVLMGCTSPHDAYKSLTALGFSNIKITGWSPFSCAKDDFYRTGFSATNINGIVVTGAVCSGFIFKNSTVRFD